MRPFLIAVLGSLVVLGAAATPALAQDRVYATPWVKLDVYNQTPGVACDQPRSLCTANGSWSAQCPRAGVEFDYRFQFPDGVPTEPTSQVRTPNGTPAIVLNPIYWGYEWVNFALPFYSASDDDAVAESQSYVCTDPPLDGLSASLRAAAAPSPPGASVRAAAAPSPPQRTLTRVLKARGRTVTTRAYCPTGQRIVRSHSSIGVQGGRRPSRRFWSRLGHEHLRFSTHARADVRLHSALPRDRRVKVQLRYDCRKP